MLIKSQIALEEYYNRRLADLLVENKNLLFSRTESFETESTFNESIIDESLVISHIQENFQTVDHFKKTLNIKFTRDFGDEIDVKQLIMKKRAEKEALKKKHAAPMKKMHKKGELSEQDFTKFD